MHAVQQAAGSAAALGRNHETPAYYEKASAAVAVRAGDVILTHGRAWTSRLIRLGQRLRFRGPDRRFAHWNHAALVVSEDGEIIEALGAGVVRRNLKKYENDEYLHVPIVATDGDREQMVRFVRWAAGEVTPTGEEWEPVPVGRVRRAGYAFLIIANLAIALVLGSAVVSTVLMVAVLMGVLATWGAMSPLWVALTVVGFGIVPKLSVSFSGEFICSGLVGRALERGGFIFGRAPVSHLMPADLAKSFVTGG